MNAVFKTIEKTATSSWFIFFAGLASIVAIVLYFYDKYIAKQEQIFSLVFLCVTILALIIIIIQVFRIKRENKELSRVMITLHSISHLYNEVMTGTLGVAPGNTVVDKNRVWETEDTLRSVCQKISGCFSGLIGEKKCIVTIKLIVRDDRSDSRRDSNKRFARTYVRSSDEDDRDQHSQRKMYEVGTGKNTGLDRARSVLTGFPAHFFSPDLAKEEGYKDQRVDYYNYYKSTIVVPVTCRLHNLPTEMNEIGFLSVDTKTRNRLNNKYHVHLMAAFADQMFSFISFMKGDYANSVNEKRNNSDD